MMVFVSESLWAKKLDWSTGYFKLVAKTPTSSGTISSVSAFQLSYRAALMSRLELSLGYSLNFAKYLSGDMGYGPDLGLFFFPFTSASAQRINKDDLYWESNEPLRPFVFAQFHQRQFQSIQASYAGFSVGGGIEYWFKPPFAVRILTSMSKLTGPLKSTASETNALIGLSVEF